MVSDLQDSWQEETQGVVARSADRFARAVDRREVLKRGLIFATTVTLLDKVATARAGDPPPTAPDGTPLTFPDITASANCCCCSEACYDISDGNGHTCGCELGCCYRRRIRARRARSDSPVRPVLHLQQELCEPGVATPREGMLAGVLFGLSYAISVALLGRAIRNASAPRELNVVTSAVQRVRVASLVVATAGIPLLPLTQLG